MARHSLPRTESWLPTEQTLPLQDNQKTILVVDDNAIVLKFVTSLLVRDYNVLSASNGKEAFQVSQNYQPAIHLLLSDFDMPGMNGIALATQISVERPQIKVLLMSGFTERNARTERRMAFSPEAIHRITTACLNCWPDQSRRVPQGTARGIGKFCLKRQQVKAADRTGNRLRD